MRGVGGRERRWCWDGQPFHYREGKGQRQRERERETKNREGMSKRETEMSAIEREREKKSRQIRKIWTESEDDGYAILWIWYEGMDREGARGRQMGRDEVRASRSDREKERERERAEREREI